MHGLAHVSVLWFQGLESNGARRRVSQGHGKAFFPSAKVGKKNKNIKITFSQSENLYFLFWSYLNLTFQYLPNPKLFIEMLFLEILHAVISVTFVKVSNRNLKAERSFQLQNLSF